MRSAEMSSGRIFVLRLEPGEMLHEVVEDFAARNGIHNAEFFALGGVDAGSRMVVGPSLPIGDRIVPIIHELDAPCEFVGTGTIFSDEEGRPIMHMHGSVGRDGASVTGCFRTGMIAWLVLEVVITELVGDGPVRKLDDKTGFKILEIR